ncbi:MAG: hypothetical protein NTZ75_09095 [Euryarchaeota archaeon]|nr:hypothetical protein [Euryarchaeota archaeon]
MKNKTVVIFVCTLLIAAIVLPVVGTVNEIVTRENKFIDNQTSMSLPLERLLLN